MANQSIARGAERRSRATFRQSEGPRAPRTREASRITDPRLIGICKRANGALKRAFDVAAAGAALIVLAPALATVALLIWMHDGRAPLYAHERVGRYGRLFRCLKFRSMIPNGGQVLQAYLAANPEAMDEWTRTQKLENDPRVTPIGKFIRKTSIDELPQLWNVLVGEMSLVGPRPITRPELDRYAKERRYYLLVRPGITGLWQVSGRSETTYAARIKYDRDYLEQWTFMRDVLIILKTIPAVLAARGAH